MLDSDRTERVALSHAAAFASISATNEMLAHCADKDARAGVGAPGTRAAADLSSARAGDGELGGGGNALDALEKVGRALWWARERSIAALECVRRVTTTSRGRLTGTQGDRRFTTKPWVL